MSASGRPADGGGFRLRVVDEATLIAQMMRKAAANRDRPGHWWSRVVATERDTNGDPLGICTYHVDLSLGVVEVVEVWHGREHARVTLALEPADN